MLVVPAWCQAVALLDAKMIRNALIFRLAYLAHVTRLANRMLIVRMHGCVIDMFAGWPATRSVLPVKAQIEFVSLMMEKMAFVCLLDRLAAPAKRR